MPYSFSHICTRVCVWDSLSSLKEVGDRSLARARRIRLSETLFYPLIISRAAIGCPSRDVGRPRLSFLSLSTIFYGERESERERGEIGRDRMSVSNLSAILGDFFARRSSERASERKSTTAAAITFPYKYANKPAAG